MGRKESREISQMLSLGFMSDRLLLALDLYGAAKVVEHDAETLERLARTLDALINLAEHPAAVLTRQATAFAYPSTESVALNLVRGEIDFETLSSALAGLRSIRETVSAIQQGAQPGVDDLERLKGLLERLAESTLEEVDSRRVQFEASQPHRRKAEEWQKILTP